MLVINANEVGGISIVLEDFENLQSVAGDFLEYPFLSPGYAATVLTRVLSSS